MQDEQAAINGFDQALYEEYKARNLAQIMEEPVQTSATVPPILSMPPVTVHQQTPVDYSHIISVITTWKDILNARLLALLSLVGSLVGFTFCMYDPQPMRLWGLGIYAVLCLWPTIALYIRKG